MASSDDSTHQSSTMGLKQAGNLGLALLAALASSVEICLRPKYGERYHSLLLLTVLAGALFWYSLAGPTPKPGTPPTVSLLLALYAVLMPFSALGGKLRAMWRRSRGRGTHSYDQGRSAWLWMVLFRQEWLVQRYVEPGLVFGLGSVLWHYPEITMTLSQGVYEALYPLLNPDPAAHPLLWWCYRHLALPAGPDWKCALYLQAAAIALCLKEHIIWWNSRSLALDVQDAAVFSEQLTTAMPSPAAATQTPSTPVRRASRWGRASWALLVGTLSAHLLGLA